MLSSSSSVTRAKKQCSTFGTPDTPISARSISRDQLNTLTVPPPLQKTPRTLSGRSTSAGKASGKRIRSNAQTATPIGI